jgi:DNA-directed RNA polymerase specialized sigma24 family protein
MPLYRMFFSVPSAARGLAQQDFVSAIPRLRRYARVLLTDADAADELVQATFARAWKTQRQRERSDLLLLLFTLMHDVYMAQCEVDSVSVDVNRRSGVVGENVSGGDWLGGVELPTPAQTMGRLAREEREVLLLVALEELHYEEVAVILSIPLATVMARLARARDKLRTPVPERPAAPAVAN